MMNPPVYTFTLEPYTLPNAKTITRIAIGNLISARERHVFTPTIYNNSPDYNFMSGSVGYMDFIHTKKYLLMPDAQPSDEESNREFNVLSILAIGIEPDHQNQGYGTWFLYRAEELAKELDADVIEARLPNHASVSLIEKLGYKKDFYNCWLKWLNHSITATDSGS